MLVVTGCSFKASSQVLSHVQASPNNEVRTITQLETKCPNIRKCTHYHTLDLIKELEGIRPATPTLLNWLDSV